MLLKLTTKLQVYYSKRQLAQINWQTLGIGTGKEMSSAVRIAKPFSNSESE